MMSLSYAQKFSIPENFEALKGSPTIFSAMWHEIFSTENSDISPSYPKLFSLPENFWNTEKSFSAVFQQYETKEFRRKIVIPPLSIIFFRYQKFSEKHKDSLTKVFFLSAVKQKFFDKKSWYRPLLIY